MFGRGQLLWDEVLLLINLSNLERCVLRPGGGAAPEPPAGSAACPLLSPVLNFLGDEPPARFLKKKKKKEEDNDDDDDDKRGENDRTTSQDCYVLVLGVWGFGCWGLSLESHTHQSINTGTVSYIPGPFTCF